MSNKTIREMRTHIEAELRHWPAKKLDVEMTNGDHLRWIVHMADGRTVVTVSALSPGNSYLAPRRKVADIKKSLREMGYTRSKSI